MKILIIEDEENLREVMTKSLEKRAFCRGTGSRLPFRIIKNQ